LSLAEILILAVALAMDAFAVSLTTGIQLRFVSPRQTLRMAGIFGFFQFAMPLAGWLLGIRAQKYIEAWDHWLAFALLGYVGGKMLWEAWRNRGKPPEACFLTDPTTGKTLLLLGLATSLDALAVGLSLALLNIEVWTPALIIGVVCFLLSAVGMQLGRVICAIPRLGSLGNKANAVGGLILIGIGLRILYEHGVF
jgi:putative Mn2+ efflux pump MntP